MVGASSLQTGLRWWQWERCVGAEAIDNDHDPAAMRAIPNGRRWIGRWLLVGKGGLHRGAEKVEAERQKTGPLAVGKKAKMPNADEAARKRVE